jgi:hypothetical protein
VVGQPAALARGGTNVDRIISEVVSVEQNDVVKQLDFGPMSSGEDAPSSQALLKQFAQLLGSPSPRQGLVEVTGQEQWPRRVLGSE